MNRGDEKIASSRGQGTKNFGVCDGARQVSADKFSCRVLVVVSHLDVVVVGTAA